MSDDCKKVVKRPAPRAKRKGDNTRSRTRASCMPILKRIPKDSRREAEDVLQSVVFKDEIEPLLQGIGLLNDDGFIADDINNDNVDIPEIPAPDPPRAWAYGTVAGNPYAPPHNVLVVDSNVLTIGTQMSYHTAPSVAWIEVDVTDNTGILGAGDVAMHRAFVGALQQTLETAVYGTGVNTTRGHDMVYVPAFLYGSLISLSSATVENHSVADHSPTSIVVDVFWIEL